MKCLGHPSITPNWFQCFLIRQAFQVIVFGTKCQTAEAKLMPPPPKLSYMPDTNVAYVNDVAGTLVVDSILSDCDILQSSLDDSTKSLRTVNWAPNSLKRAPLHHD